MKLNHFIMLINLIRPIAERSGANPAETFARGSLVMVFDTNPIDDAYRLDAFLPVIANL